MQYIFVYGVFRDANHDLLQTAVYCDPAWVYGKIYQVNQFYPGYKRVDCDDKVFGEVYLVDEDLLKELDEFEGHEYERNKIWTSIGEECWIYEYKYPVDGFKEVRAGDWYLR